jgi:hypothetical protein
MKKVIYVLFAVFTFSIALVLFQMRALVIPVTLCDARQSAAFLRGGKIRLKGFLEVRKSDDGYDASLTNAEKECFGSATITNVEELIKDEKIAGLFDELSGLESEDGWRAAEVEISTDKFEDLKESGITYCFTTRFHLKVKSLRQTGQIRFFNREEIKQLIENSSKKLDE